MMSSLPFLAGVIAKSIEAEDWLCDQIEVLYSIEHNLFSTINEIRIRGFFADYHEMDDKSLDALEFNELISSDTRSNIRVFKIDMNESTVKTWEIIEKWGINPPITKKIQAYFLQLINIVRTMLFLPMLKTKGQMNLNQKENKAFHEKVIKAVEEIDTLDKEHRLTYGDIHNIFMNHSLLNDSFPLQVEKYVCAEREPESRPSSYMDVGFGLSSGKRK
jgi:hypothetical protein